MKDEIKRQYEAIRERNRQAEQRRVELCDRLDAGFSELRGEWIECTQKLFRGKISQEESKTEFEAIRTRRERLLSAHGIPTDYLEPIYNCAVCRDKGYVGDAIYRPCKCQLRMEQKLMMTASKVDTELSFENFRDDIYEDENQRERQLRIKAYCERYADSLPKPAKPILVMFGLPGTGKSYLGSAIANRAMERFIETRFVTAYQIIQDVLEALRTQCSGLEQYKRVDFLVIDDLGTEPMVPNITIESMFTLINERTAFRKPTVIITNHNTVELSERYGERLTSRIADATESALIQFEGRNIRRIKL